METSASFEARSAPSPYPTGPLEANNDLGFSPCTFFSAKYVYQSCFDRVLNHRWAMHFVQDVPLQGPRPNSISFLCGPTKVVP